jgi:glycogen operon protein
MVRAFHEAGLEVILDLVLNHTAEGDARGPTLGLRGVDNALYYWLAGDHRSYLDFTGTGHTIRASHPIVRDLILDVLRYWVVEAHVDGFRFDLASVLGRDRRGRVVADAPLLERIAEDPILRDTKLIAEAWDAAGAYQVGSFSERRWAEWNGKFRDEVRSFWRGDRGMVAAFASRISGSQDLYGASGKGPDSSVNFVTCHDGFTMNDLVSYAVKHNESNGEGNRDGASDNRSTNYGVEGPTDDARIEGVRLRQMKNFFFTLAVSRGVPMLLMGDEGRRTQRGNNNAYCHDDQTSWLDWSLLSANADLRGFVRRMLQIRRDYALLCRDAFYTERDVLWFMPSGTTPDWSDPGPRELGCHLRADDGRDLCLLFNAGDEACTFVLPAPPRGQAWQLLVDTADIEPSIVAASSHRLAERSSALLASVVTRD